MIKDFCPECKKELCFESKSGHYRFKKLRRKCKSCSKKVCHSPEDFILTCSNCGNKMFYKTISERNRSVREKRICKKCASFKFNARRGKKLTESERLKLSGKNNPMYGKKLSDESKEKIRLKLLGEKNPFYGKKHSEEILRKNIESNSGKNHPFYGKHHSESTKEKLRMARLKWVESIGGIGPNSKSFNPTACKYLDELSKLNGWNLQHALNGGELKVCGYCVDGYDTNNNVVVEYDEPQHYDGFGRLKTKDVDRMKIIKHNMKCEFWRYNEKEKQLKKYD
jgi:hypothetical protein